MRVSKQTFLAQFCDRHEKKHQFCGRTNTIYQNTKNSSNTTSIVNYHIHQHPISSMRHLSETFLCLAQHFYSLHHLLKLYPPSPLHLLLARSSLYFLFSRVHLNSSPALLLFLFNHKQITSQDFKSEINIINMSKFDNIKIKLSRKP